METVLKFANEEDIVPNEILFHDLKKVLSKGLLNSKPEVLKACSRIISGLSENEAAIEKLLKYGDGKTIAHLITNFQQLKQQRNLGAMEDLLEIFHVLVETSEQAQEDCGCLAITFLSMISDKTWNFTVKLETSKLLNLLLEDNDNLKEEVLKSSECVGFMDSFGRCLHEAGDYELQATIMEAMFRLMAIEDKEKFASYWFEMKTIQNSFLSIRNEEFETDGRRFLNTLNASDPAKQLVFSFPALVVSLGRYKLQQPRDSKVSDFWVDMNVGSQSISTFVNDDSNTEGTSDWEMIIIKKDEIRDFRVNINEEKTILILKLYEPAFQLAPFCPEAGENYVKIVFEQKIHTSVSKALKKLFGQVKYVELPISSPSISSTPGRNLRTSMAISPLAVHSTSMPTVPKETNNEISDSTVSSSSNLEVEQEEEEEEARHEKEARENDTKPDMNTGEVNENTSDAQQIESNNEEEVEEEAEEEHDIPTDEKPSTNDEMNNVPVCPEEEKKQQQVDHVVPETQEQKHDESLLHQQDAIHFEVELEEADDELDDENKIAENEGKDERRGTDGVEDGRNIEEEEEEGINVKVEEENLEGKPTSKKKHHAKSFKSKSKSKKGKKLMRTNTLVFQDSPDELYEEAPVKSHKIQESKRTKLNAAKFKAKIGKVKDPKSLAVYEFDDEEEPAKELKKSYHAGTKHPDNNKICNERKEKLDEGENISNAPEETTNAVSTRRSRRRQEKQISYKETSTSDIEDYKDASNLGEEDEVEDDEKEIAKICVDKKSRKSNRRSESADRKSVSFVSPLVETLDQHHSPMENMVTKSALKGIPSGVEDFPLTPNEKGNADVIKFEKTLAKEEKMSRVKEWNEKNLDATYDTEFTADLTSTPMEEPNQKRSQSGCKENSSLPKPFERNVQLGWAKMSCKKKEAEDLKVYDFGDDLEEDERMAAEPVETPWSKQKKKKEKVKKQYCVKKEAVKRSKCKVESEEEEENNDTSYVADEKVAPSKSRARGRKCPKLDQEIEVEPVSKSRGRGTKCPRGEQEKELESPVSSFEEEKKLGKTGRGKKVGNVDKNKKNRENAKMKKMNAKKKQTSTASILAEFDGDVSVGDDTVDIVVIDEPKEDYLLEDSQDVEKIIISDAKMESSAESSVSSPEVLVEIDSNRYEEVEENMAIQRFYGKLDVKEEKTTSSCKSMKRTPATEKNPTGSRKSKRSKSTTSEEETNIDFNVLLKNSQDDEVVSSLESQDQSQDFLDTPNYNETPMGDKRNHHGFSKNWVKQLNDKFENIEAVVAKKQGKRKLWKSPVVIVPEDKIPPVSPDVVKQVKVKKKTKKTKTIPPQSVTTTPLQRNMAADPNKSISHTPDIGLCEGVDAFAKFCQTMLGQQSMDVDDNNSNSDGDEEDQDVTTTVLSQQLSDNDVTPVIKSPVKKKKKIEEERKVPREELKKKLSDTTRRQDDSIVQARMPQTKFKLVTEKQHQPQPASFLPFNGIEVSQEKVSSDEEEEEEYEEDEEEYDDVTPPFQPFHGHTENEVMSFANTSFGLDDISGNEGNEIQALLQTFGNNISKSINSKKQTTEVFINNVMKITSKKVKSFWQKQSKQRDATEERHYKHFISNFDDWYQLRLQKDEKIQKCIDQLKGVVKQQNDEDRQRIKNMREAYVQSHEQKKKQAIEEQSLQESLQNQIRSEIKKLKRNMLQQTKSSEVVNIRRSLQAMLNKV